MKKIVLSLLIALGCMFFSGCGGICKGWKMRGYAERQEFTTNEKDSVIGIGFNRQF